MDVGYTYYDNADPLSYSLTDIKSCCQIPNPELVKALYIKCQYNNNSYDIILDDIGLRYLANVRSIHIMGGIFRNLSSKLLPANIQVITLVNTFICDIDKDTEFRRMLPHLDSVNLESCNTEHIDLKLLNLKLPTYMRKITLLEYHINIWPTTLNICQGLQYINLSNNQIKVLPTGLATILPNLRTLDLSYNRLSIIPDLPPYITELVLNNNLITELGILPIMCKQINLGNNALQSLPNELPPELLALDISNNPDIEELPEILPIFMEILVMPKCRINRLPEVLPLNLVTLLAEHNEIQSINVVWPLSIEQINVQNNQITEIPECLATCKNLRLLNLSHNPLEKRSVGNDFSFSGLLGLQSLVLDNTGFTESDILLNNHCIIMSLSTDESQNEYQNEYQKSQASIITIQPESIDKITTTKYNYQADSIKDTIEKAQEIVLSLKNIIGSAITWITDPDE